MTEELQLTSPAGESIGQRLRARREAAGLSVTMAASKLHCDAAILDALEADRFEQLGAPVFAQGHLRRYAELVGAPVSDLLADWAQQGTKIAAPDLTRVARAPSHTVDREAWGRRLGALAGAVVIAVAAWWILQGGAVQTQPVASSAPVVPSSNEPPTEIENLDTPVADVLPVAEVPIALSVEVSADCWTEIYDAEDRRLYFDTLRVGNRAAVNGVAPLRVLLGRADRASLTIDGRRVVIPAAIVRNTTAYFTVDGSAQLTDLPRAAPTP